MALKLARLSVGWSLYTQLQTYRLHVTGEIIAVHVSINAPNKGGHSGDEVSYRGIHG
jgi:hypothetical protein